MIALRKAATRVSVVTARITYGRGAGGVRAGVVRVLVLRTVAATERAAKAGAVRV